MDQIYETYAELHGQGYTDTEIAQMTRTSPRQVRYWRSLTVLSRNHKDTLARPDSGGQVLSDEALDALLDD